MKARAGVVVLILVVLAAVGYQMLSTSRKTGQNPLQLLPSRATMTVKGKIGGEKVQLVEDPEIQKVLANKFGLKLDASKAGSIEMVSGDTKGLDFLWPASQIALEIYREKHSGGAKSEIIFNTPLVLYSWDIVSAALEQHKIVQLQNGVYWVVDLPRLVKMSAEGKKWKDLGLDQLHGTIVIHTTDPTKSSSGNLFAGLLANTLNEGDVVDDTALPKVMPDLKRFFGRLGYMESSSGDLFTQFLTLGVGSKPLIAGYEAQLVEFGLQNEKYRDLLKQKVRTLYPKPTVWSSHPLIALTPEGEKVLAAMQSPEIQKLAWERHGFRSGLLGVQHDPKVLQATGIPESIDNVISVPNAKVMERIIAGL